MSMSISAREENKFQNEINYILSFALDALKNPKINDKHFVLTYENDEKHFHYSPEIEKLH